MRRYVDQALQLRRRPTGSPVSWRVAVHALIVRQNRILLVNQHVSAGPTLSLPGGGVHLEPEETILEGSIREVYEEAGYTFSPDPQSLTFHDDVFYFTPSGRFRHMISFIVCGTVGDQPDPTWKQDHDEIIEAKWVDPETLSRSDVRRLHWDVLVKLGYVQEAEEGR